MEWRLSIFLNPYKHKEVQLNVTDIGYNDSCNLSSQTNAVSFTKALQQLDTRFFVKDWDTLTEQLPAWQQQNYMFATISYVKNFSYLLTKQHHIWK